MRSARGLGLLIGNLLLVARLHAAVGAAEPAKPLSEEPGVA